VNECRTGHMCKFLGVGALDSGISRQVVCMVIRL
jgi:hypothetical protein